jgi:DNA polymerase
MSERDELIRNLRNLVELERTSGVEFVAKAGPEVRKPGSPEVRPVETARTKSEVPVAKVQEVPPASPNLRPSALPDSRIAPITGLPATDLAAIASAIAGCQRCKLCSTRTNTVPGEGNPSPEVMFIGEGPGADEDAQGRPFVGQAGQLLTRMIEAMGFRRDEVFIANVVKCRPPGNRTPEPDEVAACLPYLERQIQVIRPKVICALGNTPLRALMANDKLGITKVRGQKLDWHGFVLIPTFHPSYLLRNPPAKKPCWEDLIAVLKALGRTPPPRKTGSAGSQT